MPPSTVLHPLTLKLTVKAPPFPDKSMDRLVIEPAAEPEPSLTAPPAWKSLSPVGKLVLPAQAVEEPPEELLLPVVIEEKSSRKRIGRMLKLVAVVAVP